MSVGKTRLVLLACLSSAALFAGSCSCEDDNGPVGLCYDVTATASIPPNGDHITQKECNSRCPTDHDCQWNEDTTAEPEAGAFGPT